MSIDHLRPIYRHLSIEKITVTQLENCDTGVLRLLSIKPLKKKIIKNEEKSPGKILHKYFLIPMLSWTVYSIIPSSFSAKTGLCKKLERIVKSLTIEKIESIFPNSSSMCECESKIWLDINEKKVKYRKFNY